MPPNASTNMPLFRLTYYSILSPKLLDTAREEVDRLIAHARIANPALELTGCLLYADHFFAQVIEGRRRAVNGLFRKIVVDRRHVAAQLVSAEASKDRLFTRWLGSAIWGGVDDPRRAVLHRATNRAHFSPSDLSALDLVDLLADVASDTSTSTDEVEGVAIPMPGQKLLN